VGNPVHSNVDRPSWPRRRWIYTGEWVLFALLAAYMGMRTLPHAWRTLNTDFPNYYLTARLAHEGSVAMLCASMSGYGCSARKITAISINGSLGWCQ